MSEVLVQAWWGFVNWWEDTRDVMAGWVCQHRGHKWEPTGEVAMMMDGGRPWMVRRRWRCRRCVRFHWLDCPVKLSGWDRKPPDGRLT